MTDAARPKILMVDDNPANLAMGRNMLRSMYEVYPVPSGKKLFELLEKVTPDLILLDIEMPEMDGYEAIRLLKNDARFEDIPVIFLTARSDDESELEGLCRGAIDYISKPFSAPLLMKRIENQLLMAAQKKELQSYNDNLEEMVYQKTSQIMELQSAVMNTIAELVEFRDHTTGGHVDRTKRYIEVLLIEMIEEKIYPDSLSKIDFNYFPLSAQLHDVGKLAISDAILKKPGKLTEEEFNEMKKHAAIGAEVIDRIAELTSEHSFLTHARDVALYHHEKWDGSGYPYGLRGYDIPLEGRLMAIADVYDALVSPRQYKGPLSHDDAARLIMEGGGSHFDPALIRVFRNIAPQLAAIAAPKR
jgi:putative two-component system response regulator